MFISARILYLNNNNYWSNRFGGNESLHDVEGIPVRLQTQQFLHLVSPHPEVAVVVDAQDGHLLLPSASQTHYGTTI